jgi:hypothetical protein
MLNPSAPALVFAPMQGVTDAPMRALQGATGSFAFAVSEFLRISRMVPGFQRKVFKLLPASRPPFPSFPGAERVRVLNWTSRRLSCPSRAGSVQRSARFRDGSGGSMSCAIQRRVAKEGLS